MPRLYEAPFKAPLRLSNLLTHYSKLHECSRVAVAWEFCEIFKKAGADDRPGFIQNLCRVGTVFRPEVSGGTFRISSRELAEYFERCVEANGAEPEFIELTVEPNLSRRVPVAAVSLDLVELESLFHTTRYLAPSRMASGRHDSEQLNGRTLGSVRNAFAGLIEIAANAAIRPPDDEFNERVARLGSEVRPGTLARLISNLAKDLEIEDFPSQAKIRDYL